jgi:hypothetical protein
MQNTGVEKQSPPPFAVCSRGFILAQSQHWKFTTYSIL